MTKLTIKCRWCGSDSGYCDCQERITCVHVGQPGHRQCGICDKCREPRFACKCGDKWQETHGRDGS